MSESIQAAVAMSSARQMGEVWVSDDAMWGGTSPPCKPGEYFTAIGEDGQDSRESLRVISLNDGRS